MTTLSRKSAAAAAMLIVGRLTVAPAQDPPSALRAAEEARFDAQVKRDTAALRTLLADDLVYIHSNALTETKSHFIETVATGRIVYDSLVPVELHHRIYGQTAVGTGKVRVQVQMNGRTLRVDLLFTTVHVRQAGRWRLVSWQSTRVP
jgi:hypothetical protein